MRTATLRVWVVLSLLGISVGASACNGSSEVQVTAAWQYDEAQTVSRAEGGAAVVKKLFTGMTVDLQFRSDNTYTLKIVGGPAPTDTEGTFKAGFGGMVLVPKTVDGKPVAKSEKNVRAPDKQTMELNLEGNIVVLKRR